ncbi:MAG: GAF domain-containing sensor histidine kinase [Myxococcota bacterium]|nr:GAF domain-containing sensor histidine kinase [Myxococcota bacterium]
MQNPSHLLRWVDAGIEPDADPALLRRARTLNVATLAMFGVGIPFAYRYLDLGVPHLALALGATMLAAALNMVVLRRTRDTHVAGHVATFLLFAVLVLSMASAGGFYDPNFAWLYVIPLAGAILVGMTACALWVAITSLTTLLFWSFEAMGVVIPNVIPEEQRPLEALINRLSALFAIGIMAGSFLMVQRRTDREIEQETAYVGLLREAAEAASQALRFDELLSRFVTLVCRVSGWPVGHVYVPAEDGSGTYLSSDVWHFSSPDVHARLRSDLGETGFEPGEGLVGRAAAERVPVRVDEIEAEPALGSALAQVGGNLSAGFAFPLSMDGEVAAVLVFYGPPDSVPDSRKRDLVVHLVEQAGRAAERLRMLDQLRRTGRMDAVGQLAAGIAHEINTPIAYVRSNLAFLEREWTGLMNESAVQASPGLRQRLNDWQDVLCESIEGVERAAGIVRDIKTCAKPNDAVHETVPIADLVDNAIRMLQLEFGGRLQLVATLGGLPSVRCASRQLEQVFQNLISNAIQAMDGIGTLRIHGEVRAGSAIVTVSDDGPGMTPEVVERIFDPFFTTKAVGEGTGLGLAICADIVRNHSGEIRVKSEPGVGTTFSVRLPLPPDAEGMSLIRRSG